MRPQRRRKLVNRGFCWLYLIKETGNTGFFKVGITETSLYQRIASAQVTNPRELLLVKKRLFSKHAYAACAEKTYLDYAKQIGAHHRGEWVTGTEELAIGLFDRACEGFPRIERRPKRRPIDTE